MIDIEKRLRRTFSSMAANESLADGLTEKAASNMLKWSETIAEQFVLKTSTMEDGEADEFLAPYASALRKMMRALGHWVVETDQEVRFEWWNRIEQNGKTLYGDRFVLPKMEVVLAQLPAGADDQTVLAFIQRLIEIQKAKG
jgi:urease accessory protein UreH